MAYVIYLGKSKNFKGVYLYKRGKKIYYHGGIKIKKVFETERQAAIFYDLQRILLGKRPINILKNK